MMRLSYWKDTLKIIKVKPFTGVGLGNFNLLQSRYAHNSYLQIWAEMGILGITSILWLIIAGLKSIIKHIKTSPHRNQIICLITTNTAFLIHNFVDFTFFLPEVALIWWIILGLNVSTEKDELNCCNSNLLSSIPASPASPKIKKDNIRGAIQDSVTLDYFNRFLN